MNNFRRQTARETRDDAARMAEGRHHPRHRANNDEHRFPYRLEKEGKNKSSYIANFTKGLPHDDNTGLVANPEHYQRLVKGIDSGDPRDFRDTPLGQDDNCMGYDHHNPPIKWKSDKAKGIDKGKSKGKPVGLRAWESSSAGQTYDLQGPDAHAVTMPPAPALGSDELIAEMAEVYAQATLRDVDFTKMAIQSNGSIVSSGDVKKKTHALNKLAWFKANCCDLTDEERARHRGHFEPHTVFRGQTEGDLVGPYISQFLLVGNPGVNAKDIEKNRCYDSGLISFGAQTIAQKVRHAKKDRNYMTTWGEWIDVQHGANLSEMEEYEDAPTRRFITTPRDLATYVHYDALYQAYLNACLLMLGAKIPFDPGIPYQTPDNLDHQQGFAHFGGPHILSLVTEVATRALKAVRFQKFNVHRRARPEVIAARLEKAEEIDKVLCGGAPELDAMICSLNEIGLLEEITKLNRDTGTGPKSKKNYLLPMAFCEGSPMHPAYGAGHATVAGACVTILKAFFDHGHPLALNRRKDTSDKNGDPSRAFVPTKNGKELDLIDVYRVDPHDKTRTCKTYLTVEGELNKLASNISIGRNWAGVHYYTDYIESLRMGEQIAIGILEEQKLTYGETFSMTVPLFDGGTIRI